MSSKKERVFNRAMSLIHAIKSVGCHDKTSIIVRNKRGDSYFSFPHDLCYLSTTSDSGEIVNYNCYSYPVQTLLELVKGKKEVTFLSRKLESPKGETFFFASEIISVGVYGVA